MSGRIPSKLPGIYRSWLRAWGESSPDKCASCGAMVSGRFLISETRQHRELYGVRTPCQYHL
ncbi:hypothetical protein [Mastigocoleus sp. MO_188.B34]|uniref:hypothetical protein n=1 Tax=Mastigocoleus sp. MO_188.B34 TaxID=3036635 RepID=UPI0026029BF9|nr:hypothetical protein [Mastigocoleus sp. MO_188.B34]MDJ0696828.1 hypothetical protein [Mastigocoleus sp. MO_188.B34]